MTGLTLNETEARLVVMALAMMLAVKSAVRELNAMQLPAMPPMDIDGSATRELLERLSDQVGV